MNRRSAKGWKQERCSSEPLDALELLSWRPRLAEHDLGALRVAFWDRDPRMVALGWGTILRLDAAASTGLAEHCSSLAKQVRVPANGSAPAPLFFGALPFDSERPWSDWPGGFFVPRLLYLERDGRAEWVLHHPANEGATEPLAALRESAAAHRQKFGGEQPISRPLVRGNEDGRAKYEALVTRARDVTRAAASGLEKVVTAREVELKAPSGACLDLRQTLEQLLSRQRDCTIFALAKEGGDEFLIGATPELLVQRQGPTVETASLAGTAAHAAAHGLLTRPKERHEQEVVTRAVKSALTPFCSSVVVSEPHARELADVVHLQSTVRGQLREPTHLLDLAAALHPTPATCGEPRLLAQRWLRDHEPLERGLYAGPLGYFDGAGNGRLVVALRCARLREDGATAYVGAGITARSNASAEWLETEHKLRAISNALRIVALDASDAQEVARTPAEVSP